MFGYLSGYNFNKGGAVLDGKYVIGVQPGGMPVTDLSWEKNTTYDAGVDMKFLDNRLSLSFDVFKKVISGRPAARYDILLPSEVGYSLPNENLNKDEYRGMEGMISYADNVGELEYNVSCQLYLLTFQKRGKPINPVSVTHGMNTVILLKTAGAAYGGDTR